MEDTKDTELENAFEILTKKKTKQERDMDELIHIISNNETFVLQPSNSLEHVKKKQNQLNQNLLKEIQQIQPSNYPILGTFDLHAEVMTEMKKEIHSMQELLSNLKQKLSDIKEDITYLKNKKSGLDKMKEAYLDITETFANKTYEKEHIVTKRIFQQVKKDLHIVVDKIFPDNEDFKDLLSALTTAYLKGGDDVYINVTPNMLHFMQFLLETDLVQYHRNDKTKIRLTELL